MLKWGENMRALVIFGSKSDEDVYSKLTGKLNENNIEHELKICSAHRTPELLDRILADGNYDLIIAGAGLAAHLPGVIASKTLIPVIGVPCSGNFEGLDAFLSILQMPPGVPVLCGPMDGEGFNPSIFRPFQGINLTGDIDNKAFLKSLSILRELKIPCQFDPYPKEGFININFATFDDLGNSAVDHFTITVPLLEDSKGAHALQLLEKLNQSRSLLVGLNRGENATLAALQLLGKYQEQLAAYRRKMKEKAVADCDGGEIASRMEAATKPDAPIGVAENADNIPGKEEQGIEGQGKEEHRKDERRKEEQGGEDTSVKQITDEVVADSIVRQQINNTLRTTHLFHLGERKKGKVRDIYLGPDKIYLVATDRQSAFDRNLASVPFKGQVLTQTSLFWFEKTKDIIRNHVLDVPDPNVVVCRKLKVFPVEVVVRGYLTGVTSTAAWTAYEKGERMFCGNLLPEGMKKNQKFEKPIITPTTKSDEHDEKISAEEIVQQGLMTQEDWDYVAEKALQLFQRGMDISAENGLILVDTKYEFGYDEDGNIYLIDEIHTPDSSRFWINDTYKEKFARGEDPDNIDKEFLRLWFKENCDPYNDEVLPEAPVELVVELSKRYIKLYEMITGNKFQAEVGDVKGRIEKALLLDKNEQGDFF